MRALMFEPKIWIAFCLALTTMGTCHGAEKKVSQRVLQVVQSGDADGEVLRRDLDTLRRENPRLYMRLRRAQEQDGAIRYSQGSALKSQSESTGSR